MDCFDNNNFGNSFENNTWNFEHNAEKLQEVLNKTMQGIMSIITSALYVTGFTKTTLKAYCRPYQTTMVQHRFSGASEWH